MLAVGIILVGAGLSTWLGGLKWHFASAVLSGVFAGIVSSCFAAAQYQIQAFGITAVITALLVGVFRKRSLVFVAALVVVFSGLFMSALPEMNASGDWQIPPIPEKPEGAARYPAADTFKILADQLFFMTSMSGAHLKGLSAGPFVALSIIAVSIIAAGIFLARVVSAVGASMIGTFFVFSGMIVLLLQKGSMPFSGIYNKPVSFQTIIVCMVIFGSVCNFILCPIRRGKPDRENMKMEKKNELT